MKVAVTGPAGYVGLNLVELLLGRGHEVVVVDNRDFNRLASFRLTKVRDSILDAAAMRAALDGVEVVFHLAAMITMARRNDLAWQVNTEGVRIVAEAAHAAGVRRMVHCSSLHAFDHRHHDGPVTEETPRSTAEDLPLYDRSKWQGECEFRAVMDRGLDGVIVNPTGVVGPVDYGPVRLNQLLLQGARGLLPVVVTGGFDMVDVRDVALGMCAAADHGRTGESYLLAGHFTEFIDALRISANWNGKREPRAAIPLSVLGACAPMLDVLGRMARRDIVGAAAIDTVLNAPRVDATKARCEFGHDPRPIEQTIGDLIAFFRDTKRLKGRRAAVRGVV